jgi:hypothetical protein
MGKMKEVFMLKREQESQQDDRLDDEYWYNRYLEEKQYAERQDVIVGQDLGQNVQVNSIDLIKKETKC